MSKAAPAGLAYTKEHEWARTDGAHGTEVTIGVTAFAVEQLGDITLVNFDVKVGDRSKRARRSAPSRA